MHNAQCTMHNLQCDEVDNVNKELMCKDIEEQVEKLQKLIGENIYGYDDETISMAIGKLLKQHLPILTIFLLFHL